MTRRTNPHIPTGAQILREGGVLHGSSPIGLHATVGPYRPAVGPSSYAVIVHGARGGGDTYFETPEAAMRAFSLTVGKRNAYRAIEAWQAREGEAVGTQTRGSRAGKLRRGPKKSTARRNPYRSALPLEVTSPVFARGTRVQITRDAWTGRGARGGTVEASYPHSGRTYVRGDDGVLFEVDTRSLEPEPERNNPRRNGIRIHRKGFRRADGARVPASTFIIPDPGRPGRRARGSKAGPYRRAKGFKPWIKHEGKLGGPGFLDKTRKEQHRLLARAVRGYGYRSTLGSLMVLNRNTVIRERHGAEIDALKTWLKRTYGRKG